MTDKEDRTTISMEARVAEIVSEDATGFKLEKYIPERQKEILDIAKKITALCDERVIEGWVFTMKCRQRTEACTFFGTQPEKCPDGFSTRICSKKRTAKQHEVNSGIATRKA